ncbi:hypothetical protein AV521_38525, partial [Streptomyces sp. IMTB 2501]
MTERDQERGESPRQRWYGGAWEHVHGRVRHRCLEGAGKAIGSDALRGTVAEDGRSRAGGRKAGLARRRGMAKPVVVGVDGSPSSLDAVETAA